MERGEVDGVCGIDWTTLKAPAPALDQARSRSTSSSRPPSGRTPTCRDVPLIMELTKDPEKLQILKLFVSAHELARPFAAPPGIPADRAAALIAAFEATMKDPDFLAETAKHQMEVAPVSGKRLADMLAELYATPEAILAKAKSRHRPLRSHSSQRHGHDRPPPACFALLLAIGALCVTCHARRTRRASPISTKARSISGCDRFSVRRRLRPLCPHARRATWASTSRAIPRWCRRTCPAPADCGSRSFISQAAPKDGLTFGTFTRMAGIAPLFDPTQTYDCIEADLARRHHRRRSACASPGTPRR